MASDTPNLVGPQNQEQAAIHTAAGETVAMGVPRQNPRDVFGSCYTLDVYIDGIKTCCLMDTGSEVTTITEAHFKQQFKTNRLSSATWVTLTAANGLDIPVVGCLYAEVECLGMKFPGKCIFVVWDDSPCDPEGSQVPGLLGMNILSEVYALFAGLEGIRKMDRHSPATGNLALHRIVAAVSKEERCCGPNGRMGYVKVAGRDPIVIPPRSEVIVQGHCGLSAKVLRPVMIEATASANLPPGLMVANVVARAVDGRVPVRLLNPNNEPVTLQPRSRLAELSRPHRVLPKESVVVEEAAGGGCGCGLSGQTNARPQMFPLRLRGG